MIPLLLYMTSTWVKDGYALAEIDEQEAEAMKKMEITKLVLFGVFGYGLGSAIVASILVRLLGPFLGMLFFVAIAYFIARREGIIHGLVKKIMISEA